MGALERARLAAISGPRQPEEEKENELTFPREIRGLRHALLSPGKRVPKRPLSPGLSRLRAPDQVMLGKQRVKLRAAAPPQGQGREGESGPALALCSKRNPNSQKSQEENFKINFSFTFNKQAAERKIKNEMSDS